MDYGGLYIQVRLESRITGSIHDLYVAALSDGIVYR